LACSRIAGHRRHVDVLGGGFQQEAALALRDIDLTKMESGKLQMSFMVNNINQVIRETIDAQKDVAASRGLSIKLELDENLPTLPFDSDRITQVMSNLLNNAIKFTKNGGITITTVNKTESNHIVVSVKDTGRGIASSWVPKVFEKFQQVESKENNEEGGTGLGLAICREIIERHGGKISVESEEGAGATFSFILPIQERRQFNP